MAKRFFFWGIVKKIYFDCHNAVFLPPGTFYLVMHLRSVSSHLLHSLVMLLRQRHFLINLTAKPFIFLLISWQI